MSENLFPSGSWRGFYHYSPPDKHRMELELIFANGKLTGSGKDDVGTFLIKGSYDANTRECSWIKTYVGSHDVYYRGFREGKGIWGAWDIGPFSHGGFHIWPRHLGEGEEQANSGKEEQLVNAISSEPTLQPGGTIGATTKIDVRLDWTRPSPRPSPHPMGRGWPKAG